ncbi:MAG: hypothetical protein WEB53_07035 [Akkermansiaceae bacterium]
MRILLDENLDWRLRRFLPGHEVDSVAYIGWSGIKNGLLLRQAADAGCISLSACRPEGQGDLHRLNLAHQSSARGAGFTGYP